MTGPQDENKKDYSTYSWYKIDASGKKQLTSVKTKKYTEVATAQGYYSYQLVTENSNGCESPVSDVFKVFVLPVIDITVTAANTSICTDVGSTTLTAKTSLKNQNLVYQWYRNGVKINGANDETYNVTGEAKAEKIIFSVSASFALNPNSPVTVTKEVTVIPQATKPMITAN
ncbi:hypothetical protein D0C36_04810 [Mucilaginibacter conchicola]|uniref:Ig-like domain-containing protein n=1 Tax=Mucilaginibacter conchicola TaxID=2303333 RepID=A0A372NXL0_9SPHI|nr:hypothetical protein [Mucilaginibacter conchicola]RFZ94858.1 hypothetical protein D0C36_04810 [Mucilaginibacter conchicola]